jgi:hypothetical protein
VKVAMLLFTACIRNGGISFFNGAELSTYTRPAMKNRKKLAQIYDVVTSLSAITEHDTVD